MKTSHYHKDPNKIEEPVLPLTAQNEDPRNIRQMGITSNKTPPDQELSIATKTLPESAKSVETNNLQKNSVEPLIAQDNCELECATQEVKKDSSVDLPSQDIGIQEIQQVELHCATPKSTSSTEFETNISINKKQYNINLALDKYPRTACDLPTIEKNSSVLDEELPSATLNDDYLIQEPVSDKVTMLDNLPLLEYNDDLEDFETLMNIADDNDNGELVPIDGPTQSDFVKEMNKDCGINTDLEIAMENAKFLDQHLLISKPKPRPKPTMKENKTTKKTVNVTLWTQTPGSPRGQLTVRTHGICKLGPEERKDKIFECTLCQYTGYSRASMSEHYSTNHGAVYSSTCGKKCGNLHALKHHEYEHAGEKLFHCKDCNQSLYFESELTSHRIKHQKWPSYRCMHHGCGKTFKRNLELNAHVEVHSGKLWYCDHQGCEYSNADKQLLKGHQRCHSTELKFVCKYSDCDEKFKYTMAHLCHYEKDH